MAYEAARQQVVLFGGQGPNNNPLYDDTWLWDGTTWTQQPATPSPPGRTLPAMAYDGARSQILLFGGFTGAFANDTWVWGPPLAAQVWAGLKNSDDQGTKFDIRVALHLNDALVAEGQALCVTGITRNPSNAKDVNVPFGPVSSNPLVSGDVLSLGVFTRIGTNPDGSKCAGHNNAVGLRLYYDAVSRPSRFGVEITPDPLTNYFLHSSGSNFFLDTAAPTATQAKQKDSGPVNFAGGNPWKEIGTWSRSVP